MEANIFTTISTAFVGGGIWMWAILIVQIVSIAIIAERVLALYVLRAPKQKFLVRAFEKDIKKGQIDDVIKKASGLSNNHPVALATLAGAQAALDMGGREEIQARMDEVLLNESAKLEKRTGFLAMLGNVGTLLGLLGTIVGLIQSFGSVSSADAAQKAIVLSQGISLAMNTTAYGLIMAIPALIMYAVLLNRAQVLTEDLNQGALKVFNWLSFNYEAVPGKRGKRA